MNRRGFLRGLGAVAAAAPAAVGALAAAQPYARKRDGRHVEIFRWLKANDLHRLIDHKVAISINGDGQ